MIIYLIGSLRNPEVPVLANRLREEGHDVFDDWYSAGFEADDKWRDYEKARGHNLAQALKGYAAQHVMEFDKFHLKRADTVVLVMPSGKSGHIEYGYAIGLGKKGYVLQEADAERYDVMYALGTDVVYSVEELIERLSDGS